MAADLRYRAHLEQQAASEMVSDECQGLKITPLPLGIHYDTDGFG